MELAVLRDDMVDGLSHPSKGVLESESLTVAMGTVPRHEFVPADPEAAYADRSFDHGGSTVLSPSTVATLLEALDVQAGHDVLVVGAGVGYTAAVAAEIAGARRVTAIDLSRPLVYEARRNLGTTGYGEVLVDRGDGARGLPEYAPFDRILVEAAAIDPPDALVDQLTPEGRLVLPLGGSDQALAAVGPDGGVVDSHGDVRFKPLLVEGEQAGGIERNRTAREDRERARRAAERRRGWEQEWIDWDQAGGLR
jgi:protein-L-isoaspartate(D-aspartate) O-methyltransferase